MFGGDASRFFSPKRSSLGCWTHLLLQEVGGCHRLGSEIMYQAPNKNVRTSFSLLSFVVGQLRHVR